MTTQIFQRPKAVLILKAATSSSNQTKATNQQNNDPIYTQAISMAIKRTADIDIKKTLSGKFVSTNFGVLPAIIQLTCISTLDKNANCNKNEEHIKDIKNLASHIHNTYINTSVLGITTPYIITVGDKTYTGFIISSTEETIQQFPGMTLIKLSIIGEITA